ncbi:uncharacterized protein LOC118206801 isoform X2 [Anguilla anguilla]|uniref:uncharacterized protein LOC118206801 isoform X2 n=1 Tax=Anguilla anguilla TaxID=7936 RepID=UPI0015B14445|nr:uncharacterized protein LOC118206801 isoform X2 [Anguilla anguilla]
MILCIFQLTCFLALGHCCANLRVRQMPESVHLKEGASVNFHCTLTYNVTSVREVSVQWTFGASREISFQRYNTSESQGFTATLPLHSVRRNQSGKYFCNVSVLIPCIDHGSGSGTSLTVEGTVSESSSSAVVWTSLLAAVLAVGIGCVIYSKRKGNKRTASTGQETDCPTSVTSEVFYAKVNFRNSSTHDRSNSDQAQYCNVPQVGKMTLDSRCLRPAVADNVVYSTLNAPNLSIGASNLH